ncbi:MAG: 30S ribosome-binding factor RbfA [Treponema sp.]|jgi:ribosome-binding factor A|nr:30S ribosome-binding factor RbfA [Treponema sp.]
MGEYRLERVGRLIQEKIGALIVEGRIKDPRVDTFLSVTRVSVSRDFSYANVYVSSFKTPEGIAKGVAGLQSAAGFIQSQIAKEVRLRQTPRLRFFEDSGMREGFDLIKKIEGLSRPAELSGSDDTANQESVSGHEGR